MTYFILGLACLFASGFYARGAYDGFREVLRGRDG
jgi:hypothetical protein